MPNWDIIVIQVRRDVEGLYMATSPQLEGVFVAHRDESKIIKDMPNIVRLWYKSNRGIDVETFWGPRKEFDDTSDFPLVMVPAEVAAKALAR